MGPKPSKEVGYTFMFNLLGLGYQKLNKSCPKNKAKLPNIPISKKFFYKHLNLI